MLIKTLLSFFILLFVNSFFISQAAGQSKKMNRVQVTAVFDEHMHKSYYILKSGRKFGFDSLYIFDNSFDNLQENKIRFRDNKTDKVGFFNEYGKIIIPALYDDAHPFINGYALVVHDGKRICVDGSAFDKNIPCEDWYWQGTTAIIDMHNKIIADDVQMSKTNDINWYSLRITKSIPDTNIYTSFKTSNVKYCTFLDFKKEFIRWFYKSYLNHTNIQFTNCFKEIMVENRFKGITGKFYKTASFIKHYQTILMKELKAIKLKSVETNVFSDELNPYEFNGKSFLQFYSNDHQPSNLKFPVFNVVSTYTTINNKLDYQQQLFFIRTNKGYKLFQVALNVGRQK
jgi:hypothetical protein